MELKKVGSGGFEYKGIKVEYDLFSDGKNIFVKVKVKDKTYEYKRNHRVSFDRDFLKNVRLD